MTFFVKLSVLFSIFCPAFVFAGSYVPTCRDATLQTQVGELKDVIKLKNTSDEFDGFKGLEVEDHDNLVLSEVASRIKKIDDVYTTRDIFEVYSAEFRQRRGNRIFVDSVLLITVARNNCEIKTAQWLY